MFKAIEAINFQVGSNLHRELTKVFQKALDYRDSIDLSNREESQISKIRKQKMDKYCLSVLKEDIAKAFYSTVGLKVKTVHCIGTRNEKHVTGMFAVDLSMKNTWNIMDIMNAQSGNARGNEYPSAALRELRDMYKNLDLNTSKLSSTKVPGSKDIEIFVDLFIDVNAAFLLHDYLPVHVAKPFTAEELSAIYIHECGHMLSLIERSQHMHYTALQVRKHLHMNPELLKDKQELKDCLAVSSEIVTIAHEHGTIDKNMKDKLIKAHDSLTYLLDQEKGGVFGATLELLLRTIATGIIFVLWIVSCLPSMTVFFAVFGGVTNEFGPTDSNKTSDLPIDSRRIFQIERAADEFASRHGAGGALATALSKLDNIISASYMGSVNSVKLRRSKLYAKWVIILGKYFSLDVWNSIYTFGYENHLARLIRLGQNQRAIFKENLASPILVEYLNDYDLILSQINQATTTGVAKYSHVLNHFLMEYANPITLLSAITTGRVIKDQTKLNNAIDELINNKLYVTSARFRSLG